MAMRYIIRRQKAEEFADIKTRVPDLDARLGAPAENLRNAIQVTFSPVRSAQYFFQTRKVGAGWVWTCPTIELVAENEKGLFALTKQFNVPKPAHLAHLPE